MSRDHLDQDGQGQGAEDDVPVYVCRHDRYAADPIVSAMDIGGTLASGGGVALPWASLGPEAVASNSCPSPLG